MREKIIKTAEEYRLMLTKTDITRIQEYIEKRGEVPFYAAFIDAVLALYHIYLPNKTYMRGDYALSHVENAFNAHCSYWISKRGFTVAAYCFSLRPGTDDSIQLAEQLENFDSYIHMFRERFES